MTTYHEWAEKKGRRPSTAFDVVEIDSILVTEDRQGHEESSTNDRHGWHCTCVACRTDRGEE